jgi:hypothetical protein
MYSIRFYLFYIYKQQKRQNHFKLLLLNQKGLYIYNTYCILYIYIILKKLKEITLMF